MIIANSLGFVCFALNLRCPSTSLSFKHLVDRRFDHIIIVVQSDWGEEYEKFNSFPATLALPIRSFVPHTHQ
jgi:hypothetical protein